MTAPKYVVREGTVRGRGRYSGAYQGWVSSQRDASYFDRLSDADLCAVNWRGRVVKLVPSKGPWILKFGADYVSTNILGLSRCQSAARRYEFRVDAEWEALRLGGNYRVVRLRLRQLRGSR